MLCRHLTRPPNFGSNLQALDQILAPSRDCFSPCGLSSDPKKEPTGCQGRAVPAEVLSHPVSLPASESSCHGYFATKGPHSLSPAHSD